MVRRMVCCATTSSPRPGPRATSEIAWRLRARFRTSELATEGIDIQILIQTESAGHGTQKGPDRAGTFLWGPIVGDPYGLSPFRGAPTTCKKGSPHVRKVTECAGRLPQLRPEEQDAGHRVPGEWREAPGHHYLVRQFLRPAPP